MIFYNNSINITCKVGDNGYNKNTKNSKKEKINKVNYTLLSDIPKSYNSKGEIIPLVQCSDKVNNYSSIRL